MAHTMTCPLCGQQHPASTTYCMTMLAEIPTVPTELPGQDGAPGLQGMARCPFDDHEHPVTETYCRWAFTPLPENWFVPAAPPPPGPSGPQVICSECGLAGQAGAECVQCGAPLGHPTGAAGTVAELPSGRTVAIPHGREVMIGRLSEIPEIRDGLEQFDAVSRRHCLVTISPAGDRVTVRDPDSANGTWVGDAPEEVAPDEARTSTLPVRLRLGQRVYVTLRPEGGES